MREQPESRLKIPDILSSVFKTPDVVQQYVSPLTGTDREIILDSCWQLLTKEEFSWEDISTFLDKFLKLTGYQQEKEYKYTLLEQQQSAEETIIFDISQTTNPKKRDVSVDKIDVTYTKTTRIDGYYSTDKTHIDSFSYSEVPPRVHILKAAEPRIESLYSIITGRYEEMVIPQTINQTLPVTPVQMRTISQTLLDTFVTNQER